MTETKLRPAGADDLAAMARIIDAAYAADRARIPDIPDVSSGLEEHLDCDTVLIAERAGVAVGVIVVAIEGDTLSIINVAVDPAVQGLGVGGALMAGAERMARAGGCTWLALHTHRDLAATRAIYRHLGWQETRIAGSTVSMQKRL